jgi:diguanylate cyclase (GGDEF)-like protein
MDDAAEIEVGCAASSDVRAFEGGGAAARDAAAKVGRHAISVVYVFASVKHDLDQVLRGVASVVGVAPIIGSSTAGEILDDVRRGSIVVGIVASPHLRVRTALGRRVSADWREAFNQLVAAEAIAPYFGADPRFWEDRHRGGWSIFATLFSPGNTKTHDSSAHELLEALKAASESRFPFLAASAADDWRMQTNFVFHGLEAAPDSALVAIFETRHQFGIALTHGFAPCSGAFSVGAVRGREILAIDGREAADALPRLFGQARAAVEDKHLSLASGRVLGVENGLKQHNVIVATYLTAGGVRLAQPVSPGTQLTVMAPDPNAIEKAATEALRKSMLRGGITHPAMAMLNYCALRERIFGAEVAASEIKSARALVPDVPFFGLLSFGEGGVSDDGVSRFSNAAVSALVIGSELSPVAKLALSAEATRAELEQHIARLKSSEAQLRHFALQDPLTELPNRVALIAGLERAISRAKRRGGLGAVLFVDLDRFKDVNDSLGHAAGDSLLVQTAQRLRNQLRPHDMLARLGGDEFVIVLEDLARPEDAGRVAAALIAVLSGRPFQAAGRADVFIGASIGVSLFPTDGAVPQNLIQFADAALYFAKNQGRGAYRYYSSDLTQAATIRLDLEARLRRALDQNELTLHYQPIFELATGRLDGAEALLRWPAPDLGFVPPDRFIPLAEETGLIVPIGDFVVREACATLAGLIATGKRPIKLSVNLSPRQFNDVDLAPRVESALAKVGVSARWIELELTEGALFQQEIAAAARMAALKKLGVSVAIDDFGVGYSSLATLKELPIDRLKIDRSFIRNMTRDSADAAIVSAIAALAKNLGLALVAEGVESFEQVAILQRIGCDFAQGFLLGKPMPADALMRFVAVQRQELSKVSALRTKQLSRAGLNLR